MKKIWETPQLIILARGTPEESVLTHCKRIAAGYANYPAAVGQVGCDWDPGDGNCGACQARASS